MEGEVKECRQGGRAEEKIARGCKSSLVLFRFREKTSSR